MSQKQISEKQKLKQYVLENVQKINTLSGTQYKFGYRSDVGYFLQDDRIGKFRFMHRRLEDLQSDLFDALDIIYHLNDKVLKEVSA